jgi:hypothetical protein
MAILAAMRFLSGKIYQTAKLITMTESESDAFPLPPAPVTLGKPPTAA